MPAEAMVRESPDLSHLLQVVGHQRLIRHRTKGAELKVVAADSDVVGGKKAGFVFVDELWQFGKKPRAEGMLREAIGGLASRPEGFVIYATTHSDEPPSGVWNSKLQYFREVRDGVIEDRTSLGVLYEFPRAMLEDDTYLDERNWGITNPNLGRSVDIEFLRREYAKELRGEGEGRQVFLAKHLNVEIGLRTRRGRWRGADYWLQCARKGGLTLEELLERCEVVVVGVDFGGLDDLLGLAVCGRCRTTRCWLYWTHAYADPSVRDLRKDVAPALEDFARDGDLTWTETTEEAIAAVVAICDVIRARRLFPKEAGIGLDPTGVGALLDALSEAGFEEPLVAGVPPQGYKISSAIWSMERKLKDLTIEHGGQRLMNFCVGNAVAVAKSNSVHITKETAGRAKIDSLIACFIATKLMEANPSAKTAKPQLHFV
jgi:phage terminase large subunit-like protein